MSEDKHVDRRIAADVRAEILRRLDAIEADNDVKIVFACESGSRAWGFASTDSDYDVRFLYLRRPEWYLAVDLELKRDVIETPLDGLWDVNGWDLRKALGLLRKSNPPLVEWLQSPIVYREDTGTAARLRGLLPEYYSPRASLYHYLNMARKNFREYLRGEQVRTKKYFYVLRPLLACLWVEAGRGAVPMEFERLVQASGLSPEVNAAIATLLVEKRQGGELRNGPRIPALNALIETELERFEAAGALDVAPTTSVAALDRALHSALIEVWGDRLRASGSD